MIEQEYKNSRLSIRGVNTKTAARITSYAVALGAEVEAWRNYRKLTDLHRHEIEAILHDVAAQKKHSDIADLYGCSLYTVRKLIEMATDVAGKIAREQQHDAGR